MSLHTTALDLPLHPRLRHPLTGEPLRALYIDRHGRVRYPIMGGDDTTDAAADVEAKAAADAEAKAAADAAAADSQEKGFPENTPVAEMTPPQQAAYWQDKARKHEQRNNSWRETFGGRTDEQIKADLAELAAKRQADQTPAEQALAQAREQGKQEALDTANRSTVEAILRTTLATRGKDGVVLEQLVAAANPAAFIADGKVDTAKVATYVDTIAPATGTSTTRRPDTGQGHRGGSSRPTGVAAGREMSRAERDRHKQS